MHRQFKCQTHDIRVDYDPNGINESRTLPSMGTGGGDMSNVISAGLDQGWRTCCLLHTNIRSAAVGSEQGYPAQGVCGHCNVVEIDGRGNPLA